MQTEFLSTKVSSTSIKKMQQHDSVLIWQTCDSQEQKAKKQDDIYKALRRRIKWFYYFLYHYQV